MFYLYEIECETPQHLYVGISERPETRIAKHRKGLAARFTARHGVLRHRLLWRFSTIEAAKKAEWSRVQQLDRELPGWTIRGAGRTWA